MRESQLSVAQFVWVRPAVVTSSLIQPSARSTVRCGETGEVEGMDLERELAAASYTV